MKYYELSYLISGQLSEEEAKNFSEKINSYLQEEGGILIKTNKPIKKILAYPIQKNNQGALNERSTLQAYLTTTEFNFLPEKLESLEKKLKKESQVLRYLIIAKKAPKVVALKKPLKTIKKIEKPKVELKEIEKKLEEILGKEHESQ